MVTTIKIQTSDSQPFIILPTLVNGKGPFSFVVDTGAGISIVTNEIGAVIGIKNLTVKEAFGAGGKQKSIMVGEVDSMRVGDLIVENAKIGITEELPGCAREGILGYDFLKNFALKIDYRDDEVTLLSSDDIINDYNSREFYIPLRLAKADRPTILVDVLINYSKIYPFILDTGASQTIVSPILAREMDININRQDMIIGAAGNIQASLGILKSLSVGKASMENVQIIISDIFTPISQATSANIHGILGYNFLHNFSLIIDYPIVYLGFL